MSRFTLMSWGKDDTDEGIRHWLGTQLMRVGLAVLPVEDLKVYHWYPDGYTDSNRHTVAISSRRIDYWTDQDYEEGTPVYLVKHDDDGVLGAFLWWKDARKAAKLLSRHYEDYHFCEHVLDEETGRVVIAEENIDKLEPNLEVERVWAHRELDWDEWDESDRVISGETARTMTEIREQLGLDSEADVDSSGSGTAGGGEPA